MTIKTVKSACFVVTVALLGLIFSNQAVFADASLSISISSGNVALELLPGAFGSEDHTITASTSDSAGYTILMSTLGQSSSLVETSDSTRSIPTFTIPAGQDTIPFASLGDGYGYSIDNGANFFAAPGPSDASRTLFRTTSAGQNTHTLTFGAKVPTNATSGQYENTFEVQIVANLPPCPGGYICYYGNGDDGTGTMANQLTSSNSSATLIPSNFSRTGYGFAGWNTAIDGSGTNYGPNETITTGDLSSQGLQLYAKWVASAGNLQHWHGCSGLSDGSVTALTDTRDGNTYAVAKLDDGVCWTIENLRLDLSDSDLEITELNTNKPNSSFATTINNTHPASSTSFCTGDTSDCVNRILFNANNIDRTLTASYDANDDLSSWYSYGNYYNWYTATAGNGTYAVSVSGEAVEGDLCPAGWKLPSGYGASGNLSVLDVAMGGTGENQKEGNAGRAGSARWRTYPRNFIFGGERKNNLTSNRAISSSYATVNSGGAARTINLWLKTDGVYVKSNSTQKNRGQTIRCIINEGYSVTGNIHYDANGGSGTMQDDEDVDFEVAMAAQNTFTRTLHSFVGWNTKADGSGILVLEGGLVTNAAESMSVPEGGTLTLYAIWRSEYSLVFDGNGESAGSMASATIAPLNKGHINLVASNYSRVGYGFVGWSLDSAAATKLQNGQSVTIYGPNEYINVNDAFLANADPATNVVTLYAVWVPASVTYTMQTFGTSQCTAMSLGDVIALKDERDNDVYAVAKLGDNHCWMVENLRLVPSVTALDNTNTNDPTSTFATAASSSTSVNTMCKNDTAACVDQIQFNSNAINRSYTASHNSNAVNSSWYSYGVFYNWYAATAGNGTFTLSSGNVAGDICPKGWRLPTGGSAGEYNALNNAINGGSTSTYTGLFSFPANFLLSGDYNNTTPQGRHSFGRYWTATPETSIKSYRFGYNAGNVTPAGSWNKWDGFAVRCIVK